MSELVPIRDSLLAIPHNGEPPEEIGFYPRQFFMLDNFSSFQVEYGGVIWPTSEHLYQASRFFETDPNLVDRKGRNELGKIWMRLRDELKAEPSQILS